MLDVDLTEDVSLHSDIDGMSQFDRAEKGSRQGQWRRRQHRWTGQDRFHDDNRGGSSQPLDGYPAPGVGRVSHHVPKSGARPEGSLAGLDEVTLRHMAQDCSSVKSQLIKLRNLLQDSFQLHLKRLPTQLGVKVSQSLRVDLDEHMEDGVKIHKALASELLTPEISEDPGSALQAEKLMREVQELREELRSKERTIAQLTQQLSAHAHTPRCQCQQRAPAGRGERRSHHDKATQTPWRGQSLHILRGVASSILAPALRPAAGNRKGALDSCPYLRQAAGLRSCFDRPKRGVIEELLPQSLAGTKKAAEAANRQECTPPTRCGNVATIFRLRSPLAFLPERSRSSKPAEAGTLPAPFFSPWQGPFQGIPRASVPHRRQIVQSQKVGFKSLSFSWKVTAPATKLFLIVYNAAAAI
ncbi:hypothetical protein Z043_101006 [Scleropages formosus]|uniref:Uncharacterized protein n=1 Tax=Scleropages formosus TaxID=113540 RepID=A0A0P7VC34_SCLFO|nr:hypothetical protein Z043_101006 [Scleropages formosus]